MSNLHPTMTQALAPFFQAIGAADPAPIAQAQPASPPAPKRPVERHYWTSPAKGLPDLAVDVIFFPVTYGRRDEWGQMMDPDYPAGAEVQAVWLGHYDIYSLLSDSLLSEIEADLMKAREA